MLNTKLIHTLGGLFIFSLFFFSCNTNKNTTDSDNIEINTLHIQLEESLTGKYISDTYSVYQPTDMSPSNRTLNQYVVNFNCTAHEFSKLKELLAADTKVEIMKNSNQADRQSSKSVKRVKTKSIRNNSNN